jgi:hypothetical protein
MLPMLESLNELLDEVLLPRLNLPTNPQMSYTGRRKLNSPTKFLCSMR